MLVQYLEIKHYNSPYEQNKEENHMIIPIDAEKHLFSRFNVHSWLKKKKLLGKSGQKGTSST